MILPFGSMHGGAQATREAGLPGAMPSPAAWAGWTQEGGWCTATSLVVLDHSLPPTLGIEGFVPVVHQGGQQKCSLQKKTETNLFSFMSS